MYMKIYDENDNIVENPDLELGKLALETTPITFRYNITQYEQGHYETVAEYPNGGKDVEWVVDIPEEGSWIAYDGNNNEVETTIVIPDTYPHEADIELSNDYMRYVLYTAEELVKNEEQKLLREKEEKEKIEQKEFLESAPTRLEEAETGVTETQEAVAELGVLASDNAVSIEDLMDAIAELGALVAGK